MYEIEVNQKKTTYTYKAFVNQKFILMCENSTFRVFYPSGYTALFKPTK